MVLQVKRHTVDEFEKFIALPENADKLFEFIGGEVLEVSPSNPYSSEIGYNIGFFIKLHLRDKGIKGHVTGEAGGYMIGGERYAPDVAYISCERQQELACEGYNPNPPELAVEVVSPNDSERQLTIKISHYLAVGTIVWVVRPDVQEVEVYVSGKAAQIVDMSGALDGGDALPGFTLAVKDIFPAREL